MYTYVCYGFKNPSKAFEGALEDSFGNPSKAFEGALEALALRGLLILSLIAAFLIRLLSFSLFGAFEVLNLELSGAFSILKPSGPL